MQAISPAFNRARVTYPGFSTYWMLVWAVAILDDAQRREEHRRRKELRRKRERQAELQRQPAPNFAPRPF